MLVHLYMLVVLIEATGEIKSQNMYFYSVKECVWFAHEINMSRYKSQEGLNAYCIPQLEDPKKVKAYK